LYFIVSTGLRENEDFCCSFGRRSCPKLQQKLLSRTLVTLNYSNGATALYDPGAGAMERFIPKTAAVAPVIMASRTVLFSIIAPGIFIKVTQRFISNLTDIVTMPMNFAFSILQSLISQEAVS
jgi:hypothetical protein